MTDRDARRPAAGRASRPPECPGERRGQRRDEPGSRSFLGDRRGVSIAISHVLTIAITTVLMSGLLIGATALLEDQRADAIERGLGTVGERLAGELARVDKAGATATGGDVVLRTEHPTRVGGRQYTMTLTDDPAVCSSPPCVQLRSDDPPVTVVVDAAVDVPVEQSSVTGGEISVVYDGSENAVRVESAEVV
jgi:hypothetical protein